MGLERRFGAHDVGVVHPMPTQVLPWVCPYRSAWTTTCAPSWRPRPARAGGEPVARSRHRLRPRGAAGAHPRGQRGGRGTGRDGSGGTGVLRWSATNSPGSSGTKNASARLSTFWTTWRPDSTDGLAGFRWLSVRCRDHEKLCSTPRHACRDGDHCATGRLAPRQSLGLCVPMRAAVGAVPTHRPR